MTTSVYNIKIDLEKSHGSYVFDKIKNRKYLDLMSMYSSLPIGYNNPIFKSDSFKEEMLRASSDRDWET